MCDFSSINERLIRVSHSNIKDIMNKSFDLNGLSLMRLRDILINIGEIYQENIDDGIYVATIPGGFGKKNYAIVAFELKNDSLKIAVSSNEGIINQHTSEGVINDIQEQIKQYILK